MQHFCRAASDMRQLHEFNEVLLSLPTGGDRLRLQALGKGLLQAPTLRLDVYWAIWRPSTLMALTLNRARTGGTDRWGRPSIGVSFPSGLDLPNGGNDWSLAVKSTG